MFGAVHGAAVFVLVVWCDTLKDVVCVWGNFKSSTASVDYLRLPSAATCASACLRAYVRGRPAGHQGFPTISSALFQS